MSSDRIQAYARAIEQIVAAEGRSEEAEDELFRFARAFEGNDALRAALTDPLLPVERRVAVADELLGSRALTITNAVVSFILSSGRASDLPAIVDGFIALSAESRSHEIAEVRSAVPLDDDTRKRLAVALSKATGKNVEVRVIVDEKVLGGLVARVGDTVIDGTVRHRLAKLKEQI